MLAESVSILARNSILSCIQPPSLKMAKTAATTKKEVKPYTKKEAKVPTPGSRQSTRTPTTASIEKAKASKAAAESDSESEEEEEVSSEEEEKKEKKTKKAPAAKKEKKEPAAKETKAKSAGTGIGEVVADVTLMNGERVRTG